MPETTTPRPLTDAALRRHVAQEVRVAMVRNGMDQRQLAEVVGISRSSLSDRLMGRVDFGNTELYRIATLLHISIVDLYPHAPANN